MAKLKDKHKAFADEYLKDLDSVRAYKAVYPRIKSDKNASSSVTRLLSTHPEIREYMKEQMEKIHNEKVADVQEVSEYLTNVMRGKEMSEELITIGTGVGLTEVKRMEKAPTISERTRAAELLGKRYGMFTDNINAKVEVPTFNGESEIEE